MVKTNSKKSLIAMIAMVVLLIASIAMGITGAWFTDKENATESTLNFGKINITLTDYSVKATNTVDTTNEHVMPGSAIAFAGTITNKADPAYIAYKVTLVFSVDVGLTGLGEGWTYDAEEKTLAYETKATAKAKDAEITLATELTGVTIPQSLGNAAMEATVTVNLSVVAVQQANTDTVITAETTYSQLEAMISTDSAE